MSRKNLLDSIQKGAKLKKTQSNDRSSPLIRGLSSLSQSVPISGPTNFVHKLHVGQTLEWSGAEPAKEFVLLDKLGEGAFGRVFRARHADTGTELAIKIVSVPKSSEAAGAIEREAALLRSLRHDSVVSYYGCLANGSDIWLMMDFCGAGSIDDVMQRTEETLNAAQLAYVMRQTLLGLHYSRSRGVRHRDIKAANIMVTETGLIKLADFGVSAELDAKGKKMHTIIGSPYWMAPEVIVGEAGYDSSADIWSLGIVGIELAEGQPPHFSLNVYHAMMRIPLMEPPTLAEPGEYPESFHAFLAKCLKKRPEQRSTLPQLLTSDFIFEAPTTPDLLLPLIGRSLDAKAAAGQPPQEDAELPAGVTIDIPAADSDTVVVSDSGTCVIRPTPRSEDSASDSGTTVFRDSDSSYDTVIIRPDRPTRPTMASRPSEPVLRRPAAARVGDATIGRTMLSDSGTVVIRDDQASPPPALSASAEANTAWLLPQRPSAANVVRGGRRPAAQETLRQKRVNLARNRAVPRDRQSHEAPTPASGVPLSQLSSSAPPSSRPTNGSTESSRDAARAASVRNLPSSGRLAPGRIPPPPPVPSAPPQSTTTPPLVPPPRLNTPPMLKSSINGFMAAPPPLTVPSNTSPQQSHNAYHA
eukprot:TRINITY_DN2434_c0_g1_i1.p1 TRINITY_DN2434_c0_g1~~TRINITY_DN2434_c0_g1_i1.p1  ORF type:complete len:662 (+),score=112.30 TRINITY_DN2434_c0_g1_i1:64-1986(+)